MGTMCIQSKTLGLALKGCKWGHLVFQRKRLESRVLPWQQNGRCHSVSLLVPRFREIFLIQYFIIYVEPFMTSSLSSFAPYKNVNISKTKKDIPKKKTPFVLTLKTLSKKQQLFFNFKGTLLESQM